MHFYKSVSLNYLFVFLMLFLKCIYLKVFKCFKIFKYLKVFLYIYTFFLYLIEYIYANLVKTIYLTI